MHVQIFSSHPDDETIGMGGTIHRLSNAGANISLCIVSDGASNKDGDLERSKIRKIDGSKAAKFLGISNIQFLDFPDTRLDEVSQVEINFCMERIIEGNKPTIVFIPPDNDLHSDHLKVHNCALVACRPLTNQIEQILSCEIPGYVKQQFQPNVYVDIEDTISKKIDAFKMFKTEQQDFPFHRSIDAIKNLSIRRGIESGLKCAEAFKLIRKIGID